MWRKLVCIFVVVLMVSVFVKCDKNIDDISLAYGTFESGVALNFDDDYTKEWVEMIPILKKYGGCATFNVCPRYHSPSRDIEDDLKILYNSGNEIGFHTMDHSNVVNYFNEYGSNRFIKEEIEVGKSFFEKLNIPVRTFAYPGGVRNKYTDSIILKYFNRVRGAPSDYNGDRETSSFVLEKGNTLLYHYFYFDKISPFSINRIKKEILRAKIHHSVLILVGHRPSQIADSDYSFSYKALDEICSFVKTNNMKFYCMSDL